MPEQPGQDVPTSIEKVPTAVADSSSPRELSPDAKPDALSFKTDWRFFAAFGALCVIVLMVALDATSLSVALPVCASPSGLNTYHPPSTH